ncbi:hypothetical protein BX616_003461 [Lobosporangium transversale]|nr:hypothetical protein BX616_003461 [Lobosporangium transversale]
MTTIGYPYTLPTTGNVSFQEFFVLNAQYQRPVSDATAFRGRLRTALKEHKHSDRHDFLNVQKALEDYIPFLFGLVAGIENTELELSNEVETTWRCTISNIALSSKQPQVKHKSIHYEAIFTLLTLGYVLMDRANEYAQSVQNKILIAIGDISSYGKGHGEGSSSVGANHGANNTIHGSGSIPGSSSATSSSEFSIGISNSSNANSGNSSSGGSSGGGGGNSASRLFKKSSSNFSAKNSNTIGEFTDYLTDDDLAAIDHQLTTAADLYCKAAGVFEYIAQDMIPKWSNNSHITSTATAIVTTTQDVAGLNVNKSLSSKKFTPESIRPVDIQTSVVSAHIRLALAEAHSCTVRKAAIKAARASAIRQLISSGSSTVASGTTPKTSYVLLAKLTIGVKEEYERAYGLLKSVKDLNEISSDFRAHVKDAKVYYEALAQTLLGMDAYEAQ